ncbi:hypothetical protein OIE52_39335 [Streptomyces canus]|uniref:hypothetical protein n=1 Tax=Streptomyces canus TaxID=58343 RepID=UPI0032569CBA
MMWAIQEDTPHGQLLSYGGKTLVHDSRAELEFLLTGAVRFIECPPSLREEDCLELRFHPNYAHHQFPIRREDYR